jgi:isoamylase
MEELEMKITQGRPQPMGSAYDGGGTNFAVFSSIADRVEVCLFDGQNRERRVELPGKTGSVWHGYVDSIAPGQLYGYRVHGPWKPAEGHLCHPQKLLLDPYGKAVDGRLDWDDALFPLDPEHPDLPANGEDTAPFMPRSVVVDSVFDWRNGGPPRTRFQDTVIYEVHVKGFTVDHPDVPPELRGTYAGLVHDASLDHFARLGVTAVELLPVQQFVHRRRLTERGLRNYWGYDPVCLFAPHAEYASDKSPGGVVNEFKEMVRTFHAAGIEVIMDVVFNHSGEGGANGPILTYKGLDNGTYYLLQPGNFTDYVDYTGTHNTLRTDHPFVRQLILDALRYWAIEMHVDGFRFDLAPVLARDGDGIDLHSPIFEAIRRDPVLKRVKLIAEPWDLGEGGYQLGRFPAEWSEWNDKYRDDARDFWAGRGDTEGRFMARFAGSPDLFESAAREPRASVNMVTCHDGFTLHDLVSYEQKHNEANGEDGRDGHDDNRSWNCGVEGPTDDGDINGLRARQKRNFLATVMLSNGTPMLLGGELIEFVSRLTRLRKAHPGLHCGEWPTEPARDASGPPPLAHTWCDAAGRKLPQELADEPTPRPIQLLISAHCEESSNGTQTVSEDHLLVMFNPTQSEAAFELPRNHPAGSWHVALDTGAAEPIPEEPTVPVAGPVKLVPHSLAVLVRA